MTEYTIINLTKYSHKSSKVDIKQSVVNVEKELLLNHKNS